MEVEEANLISNNTENNTSPNLKEQNTVNTFGESLDARVENRKNSTSGRSLDGERPKKKHRRGHKKKPRHKYKPYNKLTWDEKRKLDEKDAAKAVKRREELALQKGRPIAPYNTTQFLMEEHDPGDENFQNAAREHTHDQSRDGIDNEESCSSCSSDDYFEKDFDEFYERIHIDTLNSYSKEDLIKNVYELEQRIEMLEKDNKYKLIQSLRDENERLSKENEALKKQVLKVN